MILNFNQTIQKIVCKVDENNCNREVHDKKHYQRAKVTLIYLNYY